MTLKPIETKTQWLKNQPKQNISEKHDVSWEKSVQFYDILTRFIVNDFEANRNENTMIKKSTARSHMSTVSLQTLDL